MSPSETNQSKRWPPYKSSRRVYFWKWSFVFGASSLKKKIGTALTTSASIYFQPNDKTSLHILTPSYIGVLTEKVSSYRRSTSCRGTTTVRLNACKSLLKSHNKFLFYTKLSKNHFALKFAWKKHFTQVPCVCMCEIPFLKIKWFIIKWDCSRKGGLRYMEGAYVMIRPHHKILIIVAVLMHSRDCVYKIREKKHEIFNSLYCCFVYLLFTILWNPVHSLLLKQRYIRTFFTIFFF